MRVYFSWFSLDGSMTGYTCVNIHCKYEDLYNNQPGGPRLGECPTALSGTAGPLVVTSNSLVRDKQQAEWGRAAEQE